MPINYALFPNPLTADPSDFTAVVQANGTADFKDIARLPVEGRAEDPRTRG